MPTKAIYADYDMSGNQIINLRVENLETFPEPSSPGRLVYNTELERMALDTGQKYVVFGEFADATAVLSDTSLTYSGDGILVEEGEVINTKTSVRYIVAAFNAEDHDVSTSGGVKLYAMPNSEGKISASQVGCGSTNDHQSWAKLINTLSRGATKHIVVDVDVTLPGTVGHLQLTNIDIPNGSVIEFTGESSLKYNSDGSTPHAYIHIKYVEDLTLIRPRIINNPVATTRNARPAIQLINCVRPIVISPYIYGTSGAGILGKACTDGSVWNGYVEATLADGYHWRNGDVNDTGTSTGCYTYGCTAINCGDDGVAVVSYAAEGQPQVKDCGHFDFYVKGSNHGRGATIIGGAFCKLRGKCSDVFGQGVNVSYEAGFATHVPNHNHVDVTVERAGQGLVGAAGVEIGRQCKNTSGIIRVIDTPYRGVILNGTLDPGEGHNLDITVKGAGGNGVEIQNQSDVTLNLDVTDVQNDAVVVNNCQNTVLSVVNLREYGQNGAATARGIYILNSDTVSVLGGQIKDDSGEGTNSGADSLRNILVQDSNHVEIGSVQMYGGVAEFRVQVVNSTFVSLPAISKSQADAGQNNIPSGARRDVIVSVQGSQIGDVCNASYIATDPALQSDAAKFSFNACMDSSSAVRVTISNDTGGTMSLPAGTIIVETKKVY